MTRSPAKREPDIQCKKKYHTPEHTGLIFNFNYHTCCLVFADTDLVCCMHCCILHGSESWPVHIKINVNLVILIR